MLALMLNVLQERHLKYILYFLGLVTVGSGGFYINGTNQLNPGPGVSGFAYIVYELGAELIELNTYWSRTMRKKISKLESHYLICGYGRIGQIIAQNSRKRRLNL